MRALLLLAVVTGCFGPSDTLPKHRPMVGDNLPYGVERAKVREWPLAHDWCLGRRWDDTDEFIRCNPHEYLNATTPPMRSIIRYDAAGWSVAYAVFVPVPCTMYGTCQRVF